MVQFSLLFAFILGLIIFFTLGKTDSFLMIHGANSPFLDRIIPWVTQLGDGLFCVALFLILLPFTPRRAFDFLIIFILTGIFVQIGKRLLFPEELRPLGLLGESALHQIPDVQLHERNSFPSGHTATGIAAFYFLAMLASQNYQKVGAVIMGLAVGYSRIYLGQHFLSDVLAGIAIGWFCCSFWLYYSAKLNWPEWTARKLF